MNAANPLPLRIFALESLFFFQAKLDDTDANLFSSLYLGLYRRQTDFEERIHRVVAYADAAAHAVAHVIPLPPRHAGTAMKKTPSTCYLIRKSQFQLQNSGPFGCSKRRKPEESGNCIGSCGIQWSQCNAVPDVLQRSGKQFGWRTDSLAFGIQWLSPYKAIASILVYLKCNQQTFCCTANGGENGYWIIK